MNTQRADVVITGGGLAGLSLALQLKQRDPALAITVLERRAHPVREAAFKVGESTVEIGAHYFCRRTRPARASGDRADSQIRLPLLLFPTSATTSTVAPNWA